MTETCIGKTEI